MICPSYPDPQYLIFSADVPALLYYSHFLAIILSLLIGFLVYFKNKYSLISKILLLISIIFSLWAFINLITWTNNKSDSIMLAWSFFGILYSLLCILSVYFVYVFIDKKDISFKTKTIMGALLLPVIFFIPTSYNINIFNLSEFCGITNEGFYYTNYYYGLGFLAFLWILFLLISRYRGADKEMKKQILLLGFGIELFLFSFFITGYIAGLLTENSYSLEFYGLFGMTFFMAVLAYLIVKYEAFDVKMFGAQALIVGLVILTGSQFFFIQTNTNRILTGITLILIFTFGWALIRSIRAEIERKEELQEVSNRLASANDQLRKLDNAKSEFISIASHQLRTPLTAIKGFISLLLEGSYGKMSEEIRNVLNKIYLSNERLIELVEDLLNLSRIESGRMEYRFEKVKIDELAREVYDTFVLRAKEKDLQFELKIPENGLTEVETDRSKIREVISNLTDNALKYTIKGGVKIRLSQEQESVQVAIIDTGIGVPLDEIPYLFTKFSRGKDISRLNTGGTGLGLHVGKKMIEALGGRIWVESRGTNLGSTFFVEIPIEHKETEEF
jgi:signal transduction histidine kinase